MIDYTYINIFELVLALIMLVYSIYELREDIIIYKRKQKEQASGQSSDPSSSVKSGNQAQSNNY